MMTSVVLAVALVGQFPSPQAPQKTMPAPQAPAKMLPTPQAPPKTTPSPQAVMVPVTPSAQGASGYSYSQSSWGYQSQSQVASCGSQGGCAVGITAMQVPYSESGCATGGSCGIGVSASACLSGGQGGLFARLRGGRGSYKMVEKARWRH